MVISYSKGHKIYYYGIEWKYCDNNELVNDLRPCEYCKKSPIKEGYDACLGHLDGVKSACYGHGIEKGYIVYE